MSPDDRALLTAWGCPTCPTSPSRNLHATEHALYAHGGTLIATRGLPPPHYMFVSDLAYTDANKSCVSFLYYNNDCTMVMVPDVRDTKAWNIQAMIAYINLRVRRIIRTQTRELYDQLELDISYRIRCLHIYSDAKLCLDLQELISQHASPHQLTQIVVWRMTR